MRRRAGDDQEHEWTAGALSALRRFTHLDVTSQDRLLEQARTLDRTRHWESVDGLVVTPGMRARVAVPACLLTLNIGLSALADVTSIIMAPTSAIRTTRHRVGGQVVTEDLACVQGEALLHGPLRIAWDRVVEEEAVGSATSVVIHEFAHKIDMADGSVDGTPPISGRERSLAFERVAERVLADLREGVPVGPLRSYGATNRSELFAVATEAFFLSPVELRRGSSSLYMALADFYRQHPAEHLDTG